MAKAVKDRLVACFCGCSELTVKEVNLIVTSPIGSLLRNKQGTDLLRNYIIHELQDEDNLILKYMDSYGFCQEFVNLPIEDKDSSCLERYQELIETYPSYQLERRVNDAFEEGDISRIETELNRLLRGIEIEIESSVELSNFKEKLLKKIDKVKSRKK